MRPILDDKGNHTNNIGIVQDNTEQKRIEEQLKQSEEALKESVGLYRAFINTKYRHDLHKR